MTVNYLVYERPYCGAWRFIAEVESETTQRAIAIAVEDQEMASPTLPRYFSGHDENHIDYIRRVETQRQKLFVAVPCPHCNEGKAK